MLTISGVATSPPARLVGPHIDFILKHHWSKTTSNTHSMRNGLRWDTYTSPMNQPSPKPLSSAKETSTPSSQDPFHIDVSNVWIAGINQGNSFQSDFSLGYHLQGVFNWSWPHRWTPTHERSSLLAGNMLLAVGYILIWMGSTYCPGRLCARCRRSLAAMQPPALTGLSTSKTSSSMHRPKKHHPPSRLRPVQQLLRQTPRCA